jgi:CTP-dependent riboflavin kinase
MEDILAGPKLVFALMQTTVIKGIVQVGLQHFTHRITNHARVFAEAFGCTPYPGTINVRVDRPITIQPEFSIPDPREKRQELLIERCSINGLPGFRIRPSVIDNPILGGHGDNILEISSCTEIPGIAPDAEVTIEFFRELP